MLSRVSSGILAQPCAKSVPSFSAGESRVGTGAANSVGFDAETKMYAPPGTSILMSDLHVTRHLVPGAIVMCVVRLIMLGAVSASDSVLSQVGRDTVASVDEAMWIERVSREFYLKSRWTKRRKVKIQSQIQEGVVALVRRTSERLPVAQNDVEHSPLQCDSAF